MRRARSKPAAPIYTFRVRILGGFYSPPDGPDIQRDIEVAANQTLEDLGSAIPDAFDFDDPHLWSFFLSGKAWDKKTEYALMGSGADPFAAPAAGKATRTLIRDAPYPGKDGTQEFLFLFDFGDEWHFGVQLAGTSEQIEPKARYPRVIARRGASPPQYPDLDEDEWDDEDSDGDDDEAEPSSRV